MVTLAAGPAICLGEAGSSFQTTNGFHNYNIELGYKRSIADNLCVKATFEYGNYYGTDNNSHLSYRSFSNNANVFGLSARAEYSYLFGPRFRRVKLNSVYAFLGAGVFDSSNQFSGPNPHYMQDRMILEGNAFGAFIPYGIGYQRQINRQFYVGGEFSSQYAFSDYVDGAHSIHYSKSNDVLMGFKFTLAYSLF